MCIDDLIDEWHKSDSELPLHEFLGWSEEDYRKWVMDPNHGVNDMKNEGFGGH